MGLMVLLFSNFNFVFVILILRYVIYREVLCTYATLPFIDQRDVLSMHNKGEIGSNVIDCWALYLNAVEHIQKAAKPNKRVQIYLFGCSQCVSFFGNTLFRMLMIYWN